MKVTNLAAALLAIGIVAAAPFAALAQDKPAAKPRAGMQMDPKLQQQMMDRMKEMQAQMDKIRQTRDPKGRDKLMAEHMKSMQEGMQMMRGMGGGTMGMMGGGMGGGMMGGGQRGSGGQGMSMMEGRMDMMQMMMEQMMQHQQMMQGR